MTDRERIMAYPVTVRPLTEEEGGGYLARILDLPGCMGDGETETEAISDVRDAAAEWIDATREMGRKVPSPSTGVPSAPARETVVRKRYVVADRWGKIVKTATKRSALAAIARKGTTGRLAIIRSKSRRNVAKAHTVGDGKRA